MEFNLKKGIWTRHGKSIIFRFSEWWRPFRKYLFAHKKQWKNCKHGEFHITLSVAILLDIQFVAVLHCAIL